MDAPQRPGDLVREPRPEPWRPRNEPVYDPRIVPIVMPDLATLTRCRDALRNYRPKSTPYGASHGHTGRGLAAHDRVEHG